MMCSLKQVLRRASARNKSTGPCIVALRSSNSLSSNRVGSMAATASFSGPMKFDLVRDYAANDGTQVDGPYCGYSNSK